MDFLNQEVYPPNGYMQGLCPSCNEWEAPITISELRSMRQDYAHHGSSEKVVDESTPYLRETWAEFFQCPKCKERYSVNYSSM